MSSIDPETDNAVDSPVESNDADPLSRTGGLKEKSANRVNSLQRLVNQFGAEEGLRRFRETRADDARRVAPVPKSEVAPPPSHDADDSP